MKRFLESLIRWGLPAAGVVTVILAMVAMWMIQRPQGFFQALLTLLGGVGIGAACLIAAGLIYACICLMRNRKKEDK